MSSRLPFVLAVTTLSTIIACQEHCMAAEPSRSGPPKQVKTTDAVVAFIQANVRVGPSPNPPSTSTAEFNRPGRKVFMVWYCPTSGEESCQVHSYQYDLKNQRWDLLCDQHFHGTHDVSVEFPPDRRLLIRDRHGKQIYREPVGKTTEGD